MSNYRRLLTPAISFCILTVAALAIANPAGAAGVRFGFVDTVASWFGGGATVNVVAEPQPTPEILVPLATAVPMTANVTPCSPTGALDTTFNGTGKVTTPIGGFDDTGASLAIQADGRLVTAGYSKNSSGSEFYFALTRHNTDGTLDTSFNGSGKVTTPVGIVNVAYATSVSIQPNGRIVAAGHSWDGGKYDFALVRYNTDGTLDTTFNGTGKVTTPVGSEAFAYSVAIQPNGGIVVAGYSYNGIDRDFALVRYNPNGTLDTTFNGTGIVTTPIGSLNENEYANSVRIQSDGRIVAAGYSRNGPNNDFALVRYNTNGTLDTSFNGTGKVLTPIGSNSDAATSVAIQSDGRIVAAGNSSNGTDYDFALVRYNTDGTLDTSFNGTGKVTTAIGGFDDFASSVAIQPDGRIVAAGYSIIGSNYDIGLVRYAADGTLDTTFNGTGKVTTAIGSSEDFASSVAIQADGRIVAAGSSWGPQSAFALVRYGGGTCTAPTVTNVSPSFGTTAGGTTVTITGTDLIGATPVTFGGTACAVVSTTATQIVCTTGARAAGLVDVAVTTPGGVGTGIGLYTYVTPPPAPRLVATTGTDTGDCISAACSTIAYAIGQAVAGDTISIAAGTYTELGITVNKDLIIAGAGAPTTIVQANAAPNTAANRVFSVNSGVTASISGLTIRHGQSSIGGGIFNQGTLTITNSTISNNSASGFGGSGGGINNTDGTLTVANSTISNNYSATGGGGILNGGSSSVLTVTNSTISNNSVPAGGIGGGIYSNNGTSTVTNSTISGNSASFGGGIFQTSSTVNSRSSIIAGNTATTSGPDFLGTLTSQGYNLIGNTANTTISGGSNDILNVNPLLGSLANNGGPTQTHALLAGSPAIDKGINTLSLTTDQRGAGFARLADLPTANAADGTDIGAYEALPQPTVTSVNPTSGTTAGGTSVTITGTNLTGATAVSFGGTPCTMGTVTATTIACTTQARTAGLVDVIVTTPGGNSANTTADDYTYITPCVTNPVVTTNTDSGAGSLRNAIAVACAGSTITFDMNTVVSPIGLTSGHLVVDKNLIIQGPGANLLTVQRSTAGGTPEFRIFVVNPNVTAVISDMTVSDGIVRGWDADSGGEASGGGIFNGGALTLTNVVITNNRTIGGNGSVAVGGLATGAGISSIGQLTIINSTISGNFATGGNGSPFGPFGAGGRGLGGAIYCSAALTITNSTLSGNSATGGNGDTGGEGSGGAIYISSADDQTITNSVISGNTVTGGMGTTNGAFAFGGGIMAIGDFALNLTVNNSSVINNSAVGGNGTASGQGGGINSNLRTVLYLNNSTVSGNTSSGVGVGGSGGGIIINGTAAAITGSTISNNTATRPTNNGGGITNVSPALNVTNSTISGNVCSGNGSGNGGGIRNTGTGTTTLNNVTITNNSALGTDSASGVLRADGTVNSKNTIIAGNVNNGSLPDVFNITSGTNGSGFVSQGYNLIGNVGAETSVFSQTGDQTGTAAAPLNPMLAALANNGGPTQTHALLAGSPAIDKGINTLSLTTDQRGAGFARTVDNSPTNAADGTDIGAYEAPFSGPTVTAVNPTSGSTAGGTSVTITGTNLTGATAVSFGGTPCTMGTVTATTIACTTQARTAGLVDVIVTTPGGNSANTAADDYTYITPCVTAPVVLNSGNAGTGSLRQAVIDACAGSTITFGDGSGSGGTNFTDAVADTITLTSGQLVIDKSLTIQGQAANLLTISGNNASRVFNIGAGTLNVTLSRVTIANGRISSCSGNAWGGAIFNGSIGVLSVIDSTVANNSAVAPSCSTFPQVNARGGGIYNSNAGTVNVTNSTLANNSASVSNTFVTTAEGGAIQNNSTGIINVTNSTLSGNSVSVTANYTGTTLARGGGIHADLGTVTVVNSTVASNSISASNTGSTATARGGGIYAASGILTIRSTIVANNSVTGDLVPEGPDVFGTIISQGYNLIGKSDNSSGFTQPTDQTGTVASPLSALLGPLANNGGPTRTHALLSASSAVNAGTSSGSPLTDQRGASRIGNVDIGAFEVNGTGGTFIANLPIAFANIPFNYEITANSGSFTYSVTSGSLPNGISLNTNLAPNAVVALSGTPTQGGIFNFAITTSNGPNSNVTNYRLQVLGPTAAAVSVSGQVLTANGQGVRNAVVQLTDLQGNTQTVRTGSFGYYRFNEVLAGETYVIGVASKRFVFATRTITVADELTDVNFVAESQ